MRQHIRQRANAWATPVQLPLLGSRLGPDWQLYVIAYQPMKQPVDGAQLVELVEDQSYDFPRLALLYF